MEQINKAYRFKTLSDDYIHIGDPKDTEFHPKFTLYRWQEECFLKVLFDDGKIPKEKKDCKFEGAKVKWSSPDFDFNFYPVGPRTVVAKDKNGKDVEFTQNELGGLELEIILKTKPSVNIFSFSIQTQDLKFYYQPPLTPEEVASGCIRPENVVGSYAVYHASRTNMHRSKADAEKYKAGKAFHIYRPKATDSAGNTTWCELHIDEIKGILTITVPQEFLDKAVYPVSVDPTFGYTTVGGSYVGFPTDFMVGSVFTSPADAGTANSLTFYVSADASGAFVKGVIVLSSNLTILTNGVGSAVAMPTTAGWVTSTFSTPPSLSPNTDYVLMNVVGYVSYKFYYDTATNQGRVDTTNSYASPSNPTDALFNNNKYSIYCTYTAVAAKTVTATDACSFADPFAFYRGKYQALLDHYGFLDAFSTSRLYARLVSDTSAFGDMGAFVRARLIYSLDALGLADSYFSSELLMRWFSDDLAFADLIQTFRLKFLPLSEYASLKDSVFSSLLFNRYFSDVLSFKDLAEIFRAYSRSLTEAFSIYDLTSLLKTKPVYLSEYFNVSEVYSFSEVYYRVFSDFATVSDVLSFFKGRALYLQDFAGLADVFVQNRFFYRYLADYASLKDSVWLARLKFISYADSFSLYDFALPVKWKILQFLEASLYGEIFETRRLYSRSFVEALSLFDFTATYGFYRLLFADYFSIADQTFKFMAYARSFLDAFYAYDSWQKSQIMHKFFAEDIVLGDVYSKSKSMKLLLEETFKLLDLVDRMLIRYVVAPTVWKTEAQYLEGVLPIYKTTAKYLEGTGG
jgi:hypothetical protein